MCALPGRVTDKEKNKNNIPFCADSCTMCIHTQLYTYLFFHLPPMSCDPSSSSFTTPPVPPPPPSAHNTTRRPSHSYTHSSPSDPPTQTSHPAVSPPHAYNTTPHSTPSSPHLSNSLSVLAPSHYISAQNTQHKESHPFPRPAHFQCLLYYILSYLKDKWHSEREIATWGIFCNSKLWFRRNLLRRNGLHKKVRSRECQRY